MSALPLIALALLSAAPPRWTTRECSRGEGGRATRGIPCGAAEAPLDFEFLPLSGAGLPVAEPLCSALAAELPSWASGTNAWCIGGDGASVPGSKLDFEAFGGATSASRTLCPSGPDCASVANLTMPASGGTAATATNDTTTGPMTACFWGSVDTDSNGVIMMDGTAIGGTTIAWYLERNAGQWQWYVGDGASIAGPAGTFGGLGAPQLVCMTHAGGTAGAKSYVDGTFSATGSAKARGVFTSVPTVHGANGGAGGAGVVSLLGAFYVDAELTGAQVAALARRVLADQPKALINGVATTALTYSRTGSMFCSKADNTGTILPANRPCISQGGLLVEAAATNTVLRSQELDTGWSSLASGDGVAPTITANYGLAPDGTKTAERIQFSATTTTGRSIRYQEPGGTKTFSVFVKGVSGSGVVDVSNDGAGVASNKCGCAFTSGAWTRCVTVAAGAGAVTIGNDGSANACGSGTRSAADVLVWGAQTETGSVATSYIPTTSAAATRGAALASFAHSQATYSTGCIAVTADWAAAPSNNIGLVTLSSGSSFKQSVLTFSGLKGYVGGSSVVSAAAPGTGGSHRYILSWQPSGSLLTFDASATSGTAGTPAATDTLIIGNYDATATTVQSGRYSRIQFDPRPSRCQ